MSARSLLAFSLPLVLVACFRQEAKVAPPTVDLGSDVDGELDDGEADDSEPDGDEGGGEDGTDGGGDEGDDGSGDDGGEGSGDDGGSGDGDDDGGGGDEGGDDGSGEEPCPAGLICVSTFPHDDTNTTTGASSDRFDSYSCASSTDESGPEVVYQVELPSRGVLTLELLEDEMATTADIDVHLLASLDADDCLDRGHWMAGDLLEAGTWYVVADTWVSAGGDEQDGDYTLRFGFLSEDDMVAQGMSRSVAADALHAWDVAWDGGEVGRLSYAVTDFGVHSSSERQWIYDMGTGELEWNLHVAHGEASSSASDDGVSDSFSNTPESHQSSLGMMRGGERYSGSFGYSMRLDGLEEDYNDNVRSRAIVVHPWEGSRPEYVARYGEVAPTWGCPAIDDRETVDVVDFMSDGGMFLFHYEDGDWSSHSSYLP